MKIAVIVNPRACTDTPEDIYDQLAAVESDLHVEIQTTQFPGHATHLARRYAETGFDIVTAVGGDGTANEVLNGLIGTQTALAILPTGTANDLASFLKIPRHLDGALRVIAAGHKRSLDVVRVNGWHYLTVGALGLPCETAIAAERLRRERVMGRMFAIWMGSRIYLLALLRAFLVCCHHRHVVTISTGSTSFCMDSSSILLANQPYLGRRFHVAPKARPDDSLLDLCLIPHDSNRMRLAAATISVAMGRPSRKLGVTRMRAKRFHIDAAHPQQFMADGQVMEATTSFTIEVLHSAIQVIVPATGGQR
jgi:YegS/Rv2252/BmrU family lipid kinase